MWFPKMTHELWYVSQEVTLSAWAKASGHPPVSRVNGQDIKQPISAEKGGEQVLDTDGNNG